MYVSHVTEVIQAEVTDVARSHCAIVQALPLAAAQAITANWLVILLLLKKMKLCSYSESRSP